VIWEILNFLSFGSDQVSLGTNDLAIIVALEHLQLKNNLLINPELAPD
jgi:hypothetical protein